MKSIILLVCFGSVAFAKIPGFPDFPGGVPGDDDNELPPGVGGGGGYGNRNCPEFGIFRMPNMQSCGGYIQCDNGRSKANNCSLGTHFSVERGICMDRELADCNLCRFNREPVWFHAKEGSCTEYHVCFGRSRETFKCAPGFQFNPRIRQCDHEDNVNCIENNGGEQRLCPNTRRTTFLPSLNTCEGYLICANGGPSSFHTCAEGLQFDFQTGRCSQNAHCIHEYKPECPDDGQISFIAHIYDCRHYFICEKGEPRLDGCAPGLHFDIVARQCNKPDRATCAQAPPAGSGNSRPIWPSIQ